MPALLLATALLVVGQDTAAPDWSIKIADRLIRDKVVVGYPDIHYRPRPGRSRLGMAVFTQQVLTILKQTREEWLERSHRVEGDLSDNGLERHRARLRSNHVVLFAAARHRQAIRKLIQEFTPEMKQLGLSDPDIAQDQRMLDRLPQWSIESRDPLNRTVSKADVSDMAELSKVMFPGYGPGISAWRPPSHWELAICVHAFVHLLVEARKNQTDANRALAFAHESRSQPDPKAQEEATRFLKAALPHQSKVERLLLRYRVVLGTIGVDRQTFESYVRNLKSLPRWAAQRTPSLGEANRNFRDVPQGHWASDATRALRKEEILVGYPSGRFNR